MQKKIEKALNNRVSVKTPIVLGGFSLVAVLVFGFFTKSGTTVYVFSNSTDFIQVPNLVVDTTLLGYIVTAIVLVLLGISIWLYSKNQKTPIWLIAIFGVILLFGLLGWVANDPALPLQVTGLLQGSLALSVPLVFGALAGVIGERVGVVNIAIEGQLLMGAFASAVVASVTGSLIAGLLAAVVAGALIGLLLAVFSIKYIVDQIIVGVVINLLVSGFTGFMFSSVLSDNSTVLNNPPKLQSIPIPLLSEIPVIGPLLFNQTPIVYMMFFGIFAVYYGLFSTRWGLRLRAVGEHPTAADTVGIKVNRTRYLNVMLGGALAGLGGAFFTIGQVGAFGKDMTAGQGYIALAALIFGRWDPIKAAIAALLFGFTKNLQYVMTIIDPSVPSQFMLMLPYIVTIFAVVGLVGTARGPAAAGKPYIKS